jgi:predicted ester cyclase
MYLTAFPDLHFTVEDIIAEGDKVVTRLTCRGTQQGAFMGIPPTGKQATVTAIDINRFAGGKSVEHWLNMDTLGLLQQLGVIPAPGQ